MHRRIVVKVPTSILATLVFCALCVAAEPADDPLRDLRIRLLGAERGYVADAEWQAAFAEGERIEAAAAASRDWTTAIEASALLARALAWVPGDTAGAVSRLRAARARYEEAAPAEARRLYLAEAEILARIGDAGAIRRLMSAFRSSPSYDGRPFEYRVGEGRNTPLVIVRPKGSGENSLTLTAMSRLLNRALTAPGSFFPSFAIEDIHGRRLSSADLRGAPAVVVFYVAGSPLWPRQLWSLSNISQQHRRSGLNILAICLDLEEDELKTAARRPPLSEWWVAAGAKAASLSARLGIYGESEIFLLDREGRIIARGLDESGLAEAVRRSILVSPNL